MSEKRYQVFISSTFIDLKVERLAVLHQVLSINCIPVGMELFPATDEEQFEYIKRLIDESDYYVVIIAGRYGNLADDGLSYTEKEYDYAIKKKIPVLAFLHKNPGQIPSELTDPEHAGKLTVFRKKIETSKRLVRYWTTADNLKADVQAALINAFRYKPRTGWVRADSVMDSSQYKEQLDQALRLNEEKQKVIDTSQRECGELKAELGKSRKHESTLKTQVDELSKKEKSLSKQLAQAQQRLSQMQQQLETPRPSVKPPVKNEIYFMGRWNDKPLEWLVLDVLPDRALLIAKDCLLQAPYNEEPKGVTWEECSLRKKLLPKMLEQIFDDDIVRNQVLLKKNRNPDNARYGTPGGADTEDKLFLVSIDEVKQYFPSDEARVAYLNGKAVWWWLRSPGIHSSIAADVHYGGSVNDGGSGVSQSGGAVRPAFWLNLHS